MKKILSLIMLISLIITSVPTVYSADIADGSTKTMVNEENATWLELLGVSTDIKGDMVTRGEFLSAVIKMMNFGGVGAAKSYFDDVSAGSELGAAVEYAINLGMIGQASNFEPDRAITYYEACKIAVVALGYDINAKVSGGYPYGYAYVASKLNLTNGSISGTFSKADFVEFLTILSHTVIRDISGMESSDGEIYINYEKGVRFIERYHNIKGFEGIAEANELTHIYSASKASPEGKIMIGEDLYSADFKDYKLGTYVYGYVDSDGEIFYSWHGENEIIRIMSIDDPEYEDGKLCYYDNAQNREKKISIPADAAVLVNGQAVRVDATTYSVTDGYIELIDNDLDSVVDVVMIYKSEFIDIASSSSANEFIRDANTGVMISLYEKKYKFIGTDFASLKAGMCLEYFRSPNGEYYEFYLCSSDVSGKVNMLGDGGDMVYIGDVGYETTTYFDSWYKSLITLNSSVKGIRSTDGKLVKIEITSVSSMKFGYFYDCKYDNQGLNEAYKVKLCTETGAIKVFELDDKVKYNGITETNVTVYDKISGQKDSLIRYQTKDDKIIKINTDNGQGDFYNPASDGSDILKRYHYSGYNSTVDTIPYVTGYFVPFFFVGGDTIVFAVKPSDKEDDENKRFSVGSGTGFLHGISDPIKNQLHAYNVTKDGYAGAIVYVDDGSRDTYLGTLSAPHAIVSGVAKTINADGDELYCISLYWGDNYTDLYIEPDKEFINTDTFRNGYKDGEIPFTVGDYIRYNSSGNNLVYAHKAYDAKTNTLNSTQKYHDSELNFYYGNLTSATETSCSLLITKDNNHIGSEFYYPVLSTITVVKSNGHVVNRPVSELALYVDNSQRCKGVIVSCSNSTTKAIIVYER